MSSSAPGMVWCRRSTSSTAEEWLLLLTLRLLRTRSECALVLHRAVIRRPGIPSCLAAIRRTAIWRTLLTRPETSCRSSTAAVRVCSALRAVSARGGLAAVGLLLLLLRVLRPCWRSIRLTRSSYSRLVPRMLLRMRLSWWKRRLIPCVSRVRLSRSSVVSGC